MSVGHKHPIYRAWQTMRYRCYCRNDKDYKYYGERGITVCRQWHMFKNFYEDMADTWEKGLTLDRENTNGNYEKSNCRWVTRRIQNRNKRSNIFVTTPSGEVLCVNDAAKCIGIKRQTLLHRIKSWPEKHWFDPVGSHANTRPKS